MRRVIGMDIHRTFAEVVVWEGGPGPAWRVSGEAFAVKMKSSSRQRATPCRWSGCFRPMSAA